MKLGGATNYGITPGPVSPHASVLPSDLSPLVRPCGLREGTARLSLSQYFEVAYKVAAPAATAKAPGTQIDEFCMTELAFEVRPRAQEDMVVLALSTQEVQSA